MTTRHCPVLPPGILPLAMPRDPTDTVGGSLNALSRGRGGVQRSRFPRLCDMSSRRSRVTQRYRGQGLGSVVRRFPSSQLLDSY
jgi:hypothetical protein